MKKIKLIFLAFILPFIGMSQGIEIVPMVGYMFGGSIDFYEGKMKIDNGMDYGVSILVPTHPLMDIELNYTRMDSQVSFSPYFGSSYESQEENMSTNYIQIGAISKFYSQNTKVSPFGSLSVGATGFSSPEFKDVWRFSMTAGLGLKLMFSEKIGFLLRGRLMMPMNFAGTSMYISTGGSGISIGTYITPLQGDFNAGLIFKVGN